MKMKIGMAGKVKTVFGSSSSEALVRQGVSKILLYQTNK